MRLTVIFAAITVLSYSGQVAAAATIEPAAFDSPALAAAIRQAAPGDTVRLGAGTYELTEPIGPSRASSSWVPGRRRRGWSTTAPSRACSSA